MKTELMATVVNGVLKPDEVLAAWKAVEERLQLRPVHGGGKRFTREELHERD
jgi:hypothetical protein